MNTEKAVSDLNKALLSLEGIIYGITSDDIINRKELEKLSFWKKTYINEIRHHPLSELVEMINSITDFRILKQEEKEFIKEFCRRYSNCDQENSPLNCDSIRMKGYLQGILADKKIYEAEIRSFREWLDARPHLTGHPDYPFLVEKTNDYLDNRRISSEELYGQLSELVTLLN